MFLSQKLPAYRPGKNSYSPDQLLLRLSIYCFNKLSVSDQCLHTEEIRKKVVENVAVEQLSEESDEGLKMRTFTELLKKLPFTYKYLFISKVIKKFVHERKFGELISTFKQINANNQHRVFEVISHVEPGMNLQIPRDADEDSRLRRFTQLSKDFTDLVYKCLRRRNYVYSGNDNIFLDILQSKFSDFVLGFSTIWFQGQCPDYQKEMVDKLGGHSIKSGDVVEDWQLHGESEEDFQLRSFTTLYREKVVDFQAQSEFLHTAEERLLRQETKIPHSRLLLPQDSDSAAELLLNLSTFGFSLVFEKDQQDKIEEMSKEAGLSRVTVETDEDLRNAKFEELFSELSMGDRIECCEQLTKKFLRERRFCESILLFKQLGSHEQTELIQNLFDRIMKSRTSSQRYDLIVERLTEESEEDFRLSRFKKMYMAEPSSVWNWFSYPEAEKLGQQATMLLHTSENKEIPEIRQSRYAEFFIGFALIWFKARCALHPRNPVHLILCGGLIIGDMYEVADASDKLADESKEDFRLRRFRDSFAQLEFYSKERILEYIRRTLFHDLGYERINYLNHGHGAREFGSRGLFDPEFFKLNTVNLRGEIIMSNPRAGGGGIATRGRGRGSGTSTNRSG